MAIAAVEAKPVGIVHAQLAELETALAGLSELSKSLELKLVPVLTACEEGLEATLRDTITGSQVTVAISDRIIAVEIIRERLADVLNRLEV